MEAKEDVEPAIMNNNSARFSLTEKTPLMSKHMSSKLGYLADTDYASDILDGKFTPDPDMDEYTNKFLAFIGKRRKLTTFQQMFYRMILSSFGKVHGKKRHPHFLAVILGITKLHHVITILVKYMLPFNIWHRNLALD